MTPNQWIAVGCMAAALLCALITATILLREARYRDLETNVVRVVSGMAPDYRSVQLTGFGAILRAIGRRVMKGGRLYSQKDLNTLESMIAVAGYNPRTVLPILLGGKVVLTFAIPAAAAAYCYFIGHSSRMTNLAIIAGSVPLGLLGPDWVLGFLRRPYVRALQRGIIDALDLLVVCTEAGLGLETALERVTREMQHSNRPTANALAGLLDEIRVLPDRREAFANLAKRTGVEGVQRLTTMLAQSMQYGTPLGQALRAVSVELRRERVIKLEERAAKLPAKLVLPLILFILPCLIIILVGSSFLRLFDLLATMAR